MKTSAYKIIILLLAIVLLAGCTSKAAQTKLPSLPQTTASPYTVINNNKAEFTDKELSTRSYEQYSELDHLGRCGQAIACVGKDIMPTEKRGAIGQIRPTGWHTVKYNHIDGKYLYNRCHLIGFQLTGENANEKNLITGTRYMNQIGMLPFEDQIADYVNQTNNHVMYRVTPVFDGNNRLASGVILEAKSVEDQGSGVEFHVYCHNIQPGIEINYKNGESKAIASATNEDSHSDSAENNHASTAQQSIAEYALNRNSIIFHKTDCPSAQTMKEENREVYTGNRAVVINQGYKPCERCKP